MDLSKEERHAYQHQKYIQRKAKDYSRRAAMSPAELAADDAKVAALRKKEKSTRLRRELRLARMAMPPAPPPPEVNEWGDWTYTRWLADLPDLTLSPSPREFEFA
jgi:hypothetical protein